MDIVALNMSGVISQSPSIIRELRRHKISLERVLHKVQVVKLVNICARLRKLTSRFSRELVPRFNLDLNSRKRSTARAREMKVA